MYGVCHCCGKPAKIADQSSSRSGDTIGRPRVFLHGHSPGSRAGGAFTKRGVERSQLVPLLRWLASQYGVDGAARRLGLNHRTMHGIMYRRGKKYVSPAIAERIVRMAERLDPLPMVLTAEIQKVIRMATREQWNDDGWMRGGVNELCLRYAERFGMSQRNAMRHYVLAMEHETARADIVDNWATLLGVWIDFEVSA